MDQKVTFSIGDDGGSDHENYYDPRRRSRSREDEEEFPVGLGARRRIGRLKNGARRYVQSFEVDSARRERSRSQSPSDVSDGGQQIMAPSRRRPSERALKDEEVADFLMRKQSGPYVLHPISGRICCTFCQRTWPLDQSSHRLRHERDVHFKIQQKRKKNHAICTICHFGPSLWNGATHWHKKHKKDEVCIDLRKLRAINFTKSNAKKYVRIVNS